MQTAMRRSTPDRGSNGHERRRLAVRMTEAVRRWRGRTTIASLVALSALAPPLWAAASPPPPLKPGVYAEAETSAADAADLAADLAAAESAAELASHPPKPRPPGPAAGVAVATVLPVTETSVYRAGMLRLLNSITSQSDTHWQRVESVLGVPIRRAVGTDRFFVAFGPLAEGGFVRIIVWPDDSSDRSTIRFQVEREQEGNALRDRCAIPADAFMEEIRRDGFNVDSKSFRALAGARGYGYHKDLTSHGTRVGGRITLFAPTKGGDPSKCLSSFEINTAFLSDITEGLR